jgi:hypothetical protein
MTDEMRDEPADWQPPDWWVRPASPEEFQAALAGRQYTHDPRSPKERRLKEGIAADWARWREDPQAYRAARVAEIEAKRTDARRPTSHAIARRLLELPDLPLVQHDDWAYFVVRSARVEDTGVFHDGERVELRAVILSSEPEDGDPPP